MDPVVEESQQKIHVQPEPQPQLQSSPKSHPYINRLESDKVVLWRNPTQTMKYFFVELSLETYEFFEYLWSHKKLSTVIITVFVVFVLACIIPGSHTVVFDSWKKVIFWCIYWIFLGILSSIGVGSGLHTFILYLGPHIAAVTVAAYECHSLDFPEPPYPDEIICPFKTLLNSSNHTHHSLNSSRNGTNGSLLYNNDTVRTLSDITIWGIMAKVRLESFMWGFGSAIGELPPYFAARAHRLSSQPNSEDNSESESFLNWCWDRIEKVAATMVTRMGFWAILLSASIPNPLFDVVGIACGHYLVSFWTFFGATVIGKAIFKVHIQKLFVILMFSEHHVDSCLYVVNKIPLIGYRLHLFLKEFLNEEKRSFRKKGEERSGTFSLIKTTYDTVIGLALIYFIISVINSFAECYQQRLVKQAVEETNH